MSLGGIIRETKEYLHENIRELAYFGASATLDYYTALVSLEVQGLEINQLALTVSSDMGYEQGFALLKGASIIQAVALLYPVYRKGGLNKSKDAFNAGSLIWLTGATLNVVVYYMLK